MDVENLGSMVAEGGPVHPIAIGLLPDRWADGDGMNRQAVRAATAQTQRTPGELGERDGNDGNRSG